MFQGKAPLALAPRKIHLVDTDAVKEKLLRRVGRLFLRLYQAGSVFTAVNTEREVMTKKAPVQAPVCRKGSSDQASALLDDK